MMVQPRRPVKLGVVSPNGSSSPSAGVDCSQDPPFSTTIIAFCGTLTAGLVALRGKARRVSPTVKNLMSAVIALAMKDVRLLLRDRTGFIVTFVFPLVYAIFFGVIFANRSSGFDRAVVAVADEDASAASAALVERLRQSPAIEVELADRSTAIGRVRNGEAAGCVVIPAGFGAAASLPLDAETPMISVLVDPSRADDAAMLHRIVSQRRGKAQEGLPGGSANAAVTRTSQVIARPANHYAASFPQGIIWGILGCTASFGLSLVVERTRGTLFRLQAAPVRRMLILAGKAGACFGTTLALGVILFAVGVWLFEIRPHSYPLLAVALLCNSFAFVGVMMFVSVLGRTERAASGITWGILLAMAMLGGGMVPHFLMPTWLSQIGYVSPVRWAILAMDGAVWRGFTPQEMLTPCAVLLAIGAVGFVTGVGAFRWLERS